MRTSRLRFALAVAASFATVAATAATAATPVCSTFARGGGSSDPAFAAAADGTLWYADIAGNRLVRVGADRKEAAVVPVDAATTRLSGLAFGADGLLWYSKDSGRIGKLPPGGGAGVEYETPGKARFVTGLVRGPDGAMWFYDSVLAYVGRIDAGGAVTQFAGPQFQGRPFSPSGLAPGADGNLWVSVLGHNAIYRLQPAGEFTRFDIATPTAHPKAIAPAPDGSLWFVMSAVRKLGRITPQGQITELDIAPHTAAGLVVGADGTVWFSMPGHSMLGRVLPQGGVEKFRCGINPGVLALGPQGWPWALGNTQMIVVGEGGQAAAPVVAASAAVAPPVVAANTGLTRPTGGSAVAAVSDAQLQQLKVSAPGKLVVQFTSLDGNCSHCVLANPQFDALAAARAGEARFVRVHAEPWRQVFQRAEPQALEMKGVPTVVMYEAGQPTRAVQGNWSQAEMDKRLFGAP